MTLKTGIAINSIAVAEKNTVEKRIEHLLLNTMLQVLR